MWTYRSYRSLAQVLTAAGFAVLRFDYRGTGDSLGDETDPAAARAWIDSIHAGADALKGWVGANAVAFFGLRLGATLAIIAASERRDVRALVVWSPFVSGRAFVREARAFARLSGDASDATLQRSEERV